MAQFGLSKAEVRLVEHGPKRTLMAWLILIYAANQPDGVTCDDCSGALDLSQNSASARFHELVRSGCLISTGTKRRTSSGSKAAIYKVAPDADFKRFASKAWKFTEDKDTAILAAGRKFVSSWNGSKDRPGLVRALVKKLVGLVDSST